MPEESSRQAAFDYLVGDVTRLSTHEDVLGELNILAPFKVLRPEQREELAVQIMAKRVKSRKGLTIKPRQ